MLAMLRLAGQVHHATGGQFDPTVQPLWQARRSGTDPAPAQALVGWQDVRIDEAEISFARPGMALTLNGIAQGFAADLLADTARRHGLTDLLIDAGETRAIGPRAWHARVARPDGTPVRNLTLRDRALATSSPFGTRIGPLGNSPAYPVARRPATALDRRVGQRSTGCAGGCAVDGVLRDGPDRNRPRPVGFPRRAAGSAGRHLRLCDKISAEFVRL